MRVLGVDTSNYATSLAVVQTGSKEVVCTKKRLLPVKQGALGLRQSDAVFHHTAALPALLQELRQEVSLHGIDAVGVSIKPRPEQGSYMPCFLAGVSFASAFAAAVDVPLVETTHQQGHIAAALLGTGEPALWQRETLMFHLSGGTTELLLTRGHTIIKKLGGSLDLYAGQAVDRLGVALGFPFPAGEQVSRLAAQSDKKFSPKASVKGMDCHLSGLQNQCETMLKNGDTPADVCRYCLDAVAQTCLAMAKAARAIYPGLPVVCAGGVMASDIVREDMTSQMEGVWFVPPQLSADNAVGVALIAAKEALNA